MPRGELEVAKLLWDLASRKTGDLGSVTYFPQKPAFDPQVPAEHPFPRSTPEAQGVDSAHLAEFVRALTAAPSLHMHQLLILRHGHVIYEGGFDPYPRGLWHATYSLCKSVTNMAIGLLVDEGKLKLTDKAVDFLDKQRMGFIAALRYKDMTIRDLLIMSSGSSFNEAGAVSGNDWITNYFNSGTKFEPGTRFDYNSMNSFVLSAIVSELAGENMFSYLKRKLFDPLGIRQVFWELSPMGITKGGWGMFLRPEDAAKLAQLYLQDGLWEGQQLISREWIRESTSFQISTGEKDNPEYGYHIWMDVREDSFLFNGMLGQNAHVFRDLDMIIVTNAGNEEVFQTGPMTHLFRQYFGPGYQPADGPLPENIPALRSLLAARSAAEGTGHLTPRIAHGGWARDGRPRELQRDNAWARQFFAGVAGTDYYPESPDVGIFPLIMQVVHNNFTHGIRRIRFETDRDRIWLLMEEGEDLHRIPVRLSGSAHGAVKVNGETYAIGVISRFDTDEEGTPVLSLRIAFTEEACERLLKIRFLSKDTVRMEWSETPGEHIIAHTLEMITVGAGTGGPLVEAVMNKVNAPRLMESLTDIVRPVITAHSTKPEEASALPAPEK